MVGRLERGQSRGGRVGEVMAGKGWGWGRRPWRLKVGNKHRKESQSHRNIKGLC